MFIPFSLCVHLYDVLHFKVLFAGLEFAQDSVGNNFISVQSIWAPLCLILCKCFTNKVPGEGPGHSLTS